MDDPGTAIEAPGRRAPVERFTPVLVMLAVMWAVELIDLVTPGSLDRFGIRPRQLDGLFGIVTAPFLHDGFVHLLTNTVPFALLGGAIALSGQRVVGTVTVVVALVGGAGTWLFGASGTVHVGASALVFGYVTYLIARGFFARRITYVLGGFVVVVLYGGVLWGVVPRPGISWQGHLFGAIGGVVAAAVVHTDRGAPGAGPASAIDPAAPRARRWYEPPELP
jgi:membrane associated rhomboid family serine protease